MRKTIKLLIACGILAAPALAGTSGPGVLFGAMRLAAWFTPDRIGMLLAFWGLTIIGRGLRMRPKADADEKQPVKVVVLYAGDLSGLRGGERPRVLDTASLRILAGS